MLNPKALKETQTEIITLLMLQYLQIIFSINGFMVLICSKVVIHLSLQLLRYHLQNPFFPQPARQNPKILGLISYDREECFAFILQNDRNLDWIIKIVAERDLKIHQLSC